jgi:hypothetical protein
MKTLRRRLNERGAKEYTNNECRDPQLRDIMVAFLFYKRLATDQEIRVKLEDTGMPTQLRLPGRIRIKMGCRRRREIGQARFQDSEILRIIQEHLAEGVITDFGLTHLYTHFWRNKITISKHDLMYGMRLVDLEGV